MRLPLTVALLCAALLLPACASPAPRSSSSVPGRDLVLPETFAGVPASVVAGRAVFELESGDPARVARARGLLRSLEPAALDAWLLRASAAPEGSGPRRALLAVLSDRGETAEGYAAAEEAAACLDDIVSDVPGRRGALMAALRIRGMGERALPPLLDEARAGGPRGEAALRLLRMLGVPDRDLPAVRP